MMKYVARTMFLLVLGLLLALPLSAEAKGKKNKAAKQPDFAAQILKRLSKATLTTEQVTKVKEICARQATPLAAAHQKAALTPVQRKARAEATKKAKAQGLKGKALKNSVAAAVNLNPEQKAGAKQLQDIQRGVVKEATSLLTTEQKAKLGIKAKAKKGGKKRAS